MTMIAPEEAIQHRLAIFLDFDGTLVDIAPGPDQVSLPTPTRVSLERLKDHFDGALAIVTGRDIADIDKHTAPLVLPVAGIHGLVRRDFDGRVTEAPFDSRLVDRIADLLKRETNGIEGLLLEPKPGSIAFHYRARPDLESFCQDLAERLQITIPEIHLLRGKMVFEFKAQHRTKADAIADFMSEAPFADRVPFFAGDDVTDEDAIEAVERLGGLTVKIGPGDSAARYRVSSPAIFREWLEHLASAC